MPVLSDTWEGIEQFFEPGREILLAERTENTIAALQRADLARIGKAARQRVLDCHTADIRAREMEQSLESTYVGHHSGCGQGQPHTAISVF